MIWILIALCCAMSCNRCRRRRHRHSSDWFMYPVAFIILIRFAGHGSGLLVPLMACVAIGYFLRKIEETRGEGCCSEVTDEDLEEGLEEE